MQNNNLVGRLVISNAGRDQDAMYVVIKQIDKQKILVANGFTKTVEMPKKKNLKHILLTNVIDEEIKSSILSQDKNTNLKIKKFIKLNVTVKEV